MDEGEEVLVPSPTYLLYTAVFSKTGAQPSARPDHTNNWCKPDLITSKSLDQSEDAAHVIDPNNPTWCDSSDATAKLLIEIGGDARPGFRRRSSTRRDPPMA